MNLLRELMTITMEECGELTQSCAKVMRKVKRRENLPEDTRQKLIEEAGDVACMLELLVEHGFVTEEEITTRVEVKREKLKIWSKLIG